MTKKMNLTIKSQQMTEQWQRVKIMANIIKSNN